jgi:hypothetical protein
MVALVGTLASVITSNSFAATTYYPGNSCKLVDGSGTSQTNYYSGTWLQNKSGSDDRYAVCPIINTGGLSSLTVVGGGALPCRVFATGFFGYVPTQYPLNIGSYCGGPTGPGTYCETVNVAAATWNQSYLEVQCQLPSNYIIYGFYVS